MTAPVRAPAASGTLRGKAAAAPAHHGRAGSDAPNPRIATEIPDGQPPLRLVDTRRVLVARRRRRARLALIGAGALAVALLFAVVFSHAMLVTGQGRLDQLQRTVAEEQHRYQSMRLEVAELEAPNRIVAEAQGRLGMVAPAEVTYLTPVPLDVALPAGDLPAGDGADRSASAGGAPWATVKPLLGGRSG